MIKAHNKITYPVVNTLRTPVFIENNQNIPQKNVNVRYVIKTCKHSIIDAAVPSIRLYSRKNTG